MYLDSMVEKMNDVHKKRHVEMKQLADQLLNDDWANLNIKRLIIQNNNLAVLDYFKTEGEWKNPPLANQFKQEDMDIFLPKLEWVESQIERKKSTLPEAFQLMFLCQSTCHFCGETKGDGKYYYQGWSWTKHYMHYLVEHKVEPSAAFMVFINTTYEKYGPK